MRIGVTSAVLLAGLLTIGAARAGSSPEEDGRALVFKADGMAAAFSSSEDYLGEGGKKWREAFIHGVLLGKTGLGAGELYGGLGAIAQGTWGDGDAAGFTNGTERRAGLEEAYVGWRDRDNAFDISFGRQTFNLGDGFLISGDRISLGKGLEKALGVKVDRGGAYYLAPSKVFENTAILRLDPAGPSRGELFWLKSGNPYHQDTELAGVNLEQVSETHGVLGLSYLKVLDVKRGAGLGLWDQREGMQVASLRGQGSLGIDNLFLSAEYVAQRGGRTEVKNHASAWTAEVGWTFSGIPWNPTLNYRHARFSADKPDTARNEAFDPLFFGLSRGLGTWFQGEVASNYAGPANSGNRVKRLELTLAPSENLSLTAQYWKFAPFGQAPDLAGRELNLFAFWQINDNFAFVPLVGLYEPQGADVKALQGNDRRNVYLQAVLFFWY